MPTGWFYAVDDEKCGPALVPELKRLFELGKITKTSLVWRQGMLNWKVLKDVDELNQYFTGDVDKEKRKRTRKQMGNQSDRTAAYVTGLPSDISESELERHFGRIGYLQHDVETNKVCIKIYRDEKGQPKGDALVVYAKRAALENSIMLLDDAELRAGDKSSILKVCEADWQPKYTLDRDWANEKSDTIKTALKVRRLAQEQALSWGSSKDGLKLVVFKNLFDNALQPGEVETLEKLLHDECSHFGDVKKVTVFPYHPQGVALVNFVDSARAAELCIEDMNGKYFQERQVSAEYWDGISDYRRSQDAVHDEERLQAFADDLEQGINS